MLFKRGSTISAAEGGCQAEVGGEEYFFCTLGSVDKDPVVACSMAAAGFAACMGAPPETVLQVSRPQCVRC
jgi:L-serine deaminase